MKLSLSHVVAFLVMVVCTLAALAFVLGPEAGAAHAATSSRSDAPRPALTITTLDGKPFDLAAQRGHWVVINYWATWCGPCIKEMPALSAFDASRSNVTVIGLAYESQPEDTLRAFLRKHPVHYPVARVDPAHPPEGIAMPSVLPTTFLVAPDGHLARKFIGPLDLKALAAAIPSEATP